MNLIDRISLSTKRIVFGHGDSHQLIKLKFKKCDGVPRFATFFPVANKESLRAELEFQSSNLIKDLKDRHAVGVIENGTEANLTLILSAIIHPDDGAKGFLYVKPLTSLTEEDARREAPDLWRVPLAELQAGCERIEFTVRRVKPLMSKKPRSMQQQTATSTVVQGVMNDSDGLFRGWVIYTSDFLINRNTGGRWYVEWAVTFFLLLLMVIGAACIVVMIMMIARREKRQNESNDL